MSEVPLIGDEELAYFYDWIKPVVRFLRINGKYRQADEGELYFIEHVNPRDNNYITQAKPKELARGLHKVASRKIAYNSGGYGSQSIGIAEVIAQIPTELRDQVIAFECVDISWPERNGYGEAKVVLYEYSANEAEYERQVLSLIHI